MSVDVTYIGPEGIFTYRSAPSGTQYVFYSGLPTNVSIPGDVEYFKGMVSHKGNFRIGPIVKKSVDKPKPKKKEVKR